MRHSSTGIAVIADGFDQAFKLRLGNSAWLPQAVPETVIFKGEKLFQIGPGAGPQISFILCNK